MVVRSLGAVDRAVCDLGPAKAEGGGFIKIIYKVDGTILGRLRGASSRPLGGELRRASLLLSSCNKRGGNQHILSALHCGCFFPARRRGSRGIALRWGTGI